jgi:hypothetical protein
MSKTFLPMMLTVFASVGTYYLLVTEAGLSDNLSMAGGVMAAILSAVITRRLFDRKK